MTDGDVASVSVTESTEGAPVDIAYVFPGETFAPEEVRINVPAQDGAGPRAARLDVLVSTVAGHARFHAVRSVALDACEARQTFRFPAAAARWVMVRLTPAAGQSRLSVVDVELMWHQGPPQNRYAFAESPARAMDPLSRLAGSREVGVAISKDETAAFAAARAGQLDGKALADFALVAFGVLDRGRRAGYLRRIDALKTEPRKAVAGS